MKNKSLCTCLDGWAPLTDYAHLPLVWNCGSSMFGVLLISKQLQEVISYFIKSNLHNTNS